MPRVLWPDIDGAQRHPFRTNQRMEVDETGYKDVLANLREFKSISLFRTLCTAAVAREPDHRHLVGVHKIFRKMDINGDGI